MIGLSTVEAKLPPGFRFHPKDEELICNYLMKWVTGCAQQTPLLIEVDLNKCEPWDIPETACVGGKEWYFYSQRDRKYATGLRTNRATVSGYWKATGKDRPVLRKGTTLVGMRKTLVFYQGRAPKGKKTDWVMHEFRLEGTLGPVPKQVSSVKEEDWVLCRMFYKNRSEDPGKQETGNISSHDYEQITASSSSLSLPPLMEPYINNISFHQQIITDQATSTTDYNYQHHQQVPCFSNIYNQTAPNNFSHVSPTHNQESVVMPTKMMMPNLIGQTTFPYFGIDYNSQSSLDHTNPSSCDKKVIKAVLNHLTKIESCDDHHHDNNKFTTMKNSPASFGEGSSDSYLSEVGLMSSMWSQY